MVGHADWPINQRTELYATSYLPRSIQVDRRPNPHHLIERRDILVPQAHAAVTRRLADALRLVGPVDAIAIAHLQAVGAEYALVLPLVGAVGRNYDVAVCRDLMPLASATQRRHSAVRIPSDDVCAVHLDRAAIAGLK